MQLLSNRDPRMFNAAFYEWSTDSSGIKALVAEYEDMRALQRATGIDPFTYDLDESSGQMEKSKAMTLAFAHELFVGREPVAANLAVGLVLFEGRAERPEEKGHQFDRRMMTSTSKIPDVGVAFCGMDTNTTHEKS